MYVMNNKLIIYIIVEEILGIETISTKNAAKTVKVNEQYLKPYDS